MKNSFVIITAGGIGKRLNQSLPKQFLTIAGYPLLWHSVKRFYEALNPKKILITLPESYLDYWNALCGSYGLSIPHEVVTGGEERFHSVQYALSKVSDSEGLVGIHDGVRPFVSNELIQRVWKEAQENEAAVPAIPLKDTIRKYSGDYWKAEDRASFRSIQTPQVFDLRKLKTAYQENLGTNVTDDAMVWEASGKSISLVNGEESNLKITNEWDFEFAQVLGQKLAAK